MAQRWLPLSFAVILPVAARLPQPFADWCTALRGRVSAWLNADWRTVVHRDRTLKSRTHQAFSALGFPSPEQLVRQRYQAQAYEEWVSECMSIGRLSSPTELSVEITERIAGLPATQGIVFATIHWAESTIGSAYLGALGRPTCVMNARFVESDGVPPSIRSHYRAKYRAMDAHLNPGRCIAVEDGVRPFIRHLRQGGAVAMTVDIPDPSQSAVTEQWFGHSCQLSPGLRHLESSTGSLVIPYVARFDANQWRFDFAGSDESPYAFFARMIHEDPARWWAADLFPIAAGLEAHSKDEGLTQ